MSEQNAAAPEFAAQRQASRGPAADAHRQQADSKYAAHEGGDVNWWITWMRCSTCMLMFAGQEGDESLTSPGAGSTLSCSVLSGPKDSTCGFGWAGSHGCPDTEHMPAATEAHLALVLCWLAHRPAAADSDLKQWMKGDLASVLSSKAAQQVAGMHIGLSNTEVQQQASCQVGAGIQHAVRALARGPQSLAQPGNKTWQTNNNIWQTNLSQAARAAPRDRSRPQLGPGC